MIRTTLRDIARHTACAHSTVSLALRGSPKVNPETSALILSAARKLGYRPHPLISALMQSRRTRTASHLRGQIAFLGFHGEQADATSVTPTPILAGAVARAQELGYHVERLWADTPEITDYRLARILEARGIHGVIVGPAPKCAAAVVLPWHRLACVSLNLGTPPGADFVGHNYYDGMNLALRECRLRNFRRIGVALPAERNSEMLDQYLLPLRGAQASLPLRDQVPPLLYPSDPAGAIRRWIARVEPDVIVSLVDSEQGPEFVRSQIPPEIAYLSLNASAGVTAGIDQNRPLIGEIAVDQLVAKLNRNEIGLGQHARLTFVSGRWIPGPRSEERASSHEEEPFFDRLHCRV